MRSETESNNEDTFVLILCVYSHFISHIPEGSVCQSKAIKGFTYHVSSARLYNNAVAAVTFTFYVKNAIALLNVIKVIDDTVYSAHSKTDS